MQPHSALELGPWESFYVITGSSGAALTGLMFVVVTLAAEARATDPAGVRGFATPTVVHFGTVLLIACVLTIPGHTIASLRWCLLGCLAVGVGFLARGLKSMLGPGRYQPVLEDWIFHAILPTVAYVALFASIMMLSPRSATALYMIAAIVILLLFIGIHNAWDAAMWLALDGTPSSATAATATESSPAPARPQSPPETRTLP